MQKTFILLCRREKQKKSMPFLRKFTVSASNSIFWKCEVSRLHVLHVCTWVTQRDEREKSDEWNGDRIKLIDREQEKEAKRGDDMMAHLRKDAQNSTGNFVWKPRMGFALSKTFSLRREFYNSFYGTSAAAAAANNRYHKLKQNEKKNPKFCFCFVTHDFHFSGAGEKVSFSYLMHWIWSSRAQYLWKSSCVNTLLNGIRRNLETKKEHNAPIKFGSKNGLPTRNWSFESFRFDWNERPKCTRSVLGNSFRFA